MSQPSIYKIKITYRDGTQDTISLDEEANITADLQHPIPLKRRKALVEFILSIRTWLLHNNGIKLEMEEEI